MRYLRCFGLKVITDNYEGRVCRRHIIGLLESNCMAAVRCEIENDLRLLRTIQADITHIFKIIKWALSVRHIELKCHSSVTNIYTVSRNLYSLSILVTFYYWSIVINIERPRQGAKCVRHGTEFDEARC